MSRQGLCLMMGLVACSQGKGGWKEGADDAFGEVVVPPPGEGTEDDTGDTNPGDTEPGDTEPGDPVHRGDLALRSDSDIEDFCGRFTAVEGNLSVGGEVADLSGLSCLQTVSGSLSISSALLQTTAGLDGLSAVGGGLLIGGEALTTVEGFAGLAAIGGDLRIDGAPALGTLAGLEGLETVGGDVVIASLPTLSSWAGMASLQTVGGELRIESLVGLRAAPAFPGLVELPALTLRETGFVCPSFPALSSAGEITIDGCGEGVVDLLPALISVQGPLELTLGEGVLSLTLAPGLTSVGGLHLSLAGVSTLDDFAALEAITGDLAIVDSLRLTAVPALPRLGKVEGDLVITGGTSLVDLDGLATITRVGGDLTIERCRYVERLDGLVNLREVGGDVSLASLTRLSSTEALAGLSTVGGGLSIDANARLTELSGLTQLPSLGGDLVITNNGWLLTAVAEALAEAIGREDIAGDVIIEGNRAE